MMIELPDEFEIARGSLRYSTMDMGDWYVTFGIDPEGFDLAMAGRLAGMIVPADVDQERLDQLLADIRHFGGVRFVVTPRSQQSS